MKIITEIITKLEEIINDIYIQDYHKASLSFQEVLPVIFTIEEIKNELENKESEISMVMTETVMALQKTDMLLFSDLIKEILIPRLKTFVEVKNTIEYGEYLLEGTSSGYYTVKDKKTDLYLHSNSDPKKEAYTFISHLLDTSKRKYVVWGAGLGYHVEQLYNLTLGAVEIEVYDENENIFDLAEEYGVIKEIKNYIRCIYDPNGVNFIKAIQEKEIGIIIHYPSLKVIKNQTFKESIEKLYLGWNGTVQLKRNLEINFRSNIVQIERNVDEIVEKLKGKEVFLVAAGPSLDDSMEILKTKKEEDMVVSVTTVLKKLCKAGIFPDYTVVMDSQERTIKQIEGAEDYKVPMIIGSTSYWKFAKEYKGEKYISYQKDYSLAEEKAKEGNYNIYATGGSVLTLALSILLKSKVKRINLIGVDLAFANGVTHASDTMDRQKIDTTGMKKMKSVSGDVVYTDKKMLSYLKWIEKEIKKYPDTKVYNYSEIGAVIEGTYNP